MKEDKRIKYIKNIINFSGITHRKKQGYNKNLIQTFPKNFGSIQFNSLSHSSKNLQKRGIRY